MNGKILIDLSNSVIFSEGKPTTLLVANTDSIAEQIQRTYPQVKVVKTLNSVGASVMVNPRQVADGEHDLFLSGNDPGCQRPGDPAADLLVWVAAHY